MRRLIAAMIAVCCLAAGPSASETDAAIRVVENLYGRGAFDEASRRLNDLLVIEVQLGPKDQGRIYLLKARLEFAFNRKDEVKLWLGRAHAADPDLALDPVRDPPPLIAQWEHLKSPAAMARSVDPGTATSASAIDGPSSFAMALLPFGIGHFDAGRARDGALFLTTEALIGVGAHSLSGFEGTSEGSSERQEAAHARAIVGGAGLIGAYGFELVSILPDLTKVSPDSAARLSKHLSLAPFGAAQAKNGNYVRAGVVASLQTGMLLTAGMAPTDGQRRTALGAFTLTWIYAAYDGYRHHNAAAMTADAPQLRMFPLIGAKTYGAGFAFTLSSR